jgi:hypothetical protein
MLMTIKIFLTAICISFTIGLQAQTLGEFNAKTSEMGKGKLQKLQNVFTLPVLM